MIAEDKKIKEIYLVRHGETDWNKENKIQGKNNIPLNSTGIKQSNDVAKYLKDKNIGCIYSSPLERTEQTAEIIQKGLGGSVKIKTVRDLKEDNPSSIEGKEIKNMTPNTVVELVKNFKKKNGHLPKETEGMINKLNKTVLDICKETPCDNIVIVAHSSAIWSMLVANNCPDISLPSNGEIIKIRYCDEKFIDIERIKPE